MGLFLFAIVFIYHIYYLVGYGNWNYKMAYTGILSKKFTGLFLIFTALGIIGLFHFLYSL